MKPISRLACQTIAIASIFFGANLCLGFQVEDLKSTSLVYPSVKPIEGRVVDESGWPVVGAVVGQFQRSQDNPPNAIMPPFDIANRATTDVRGRFKLTKVDHRFPFLFNVYHPEFLIQGMQPLEIFGEIVLTKPTLVSGRVVKHDGTPAKDFLISLGPAPAKDIIGFEYGEIEIGDNGKFDLPTGHGTEANFFITLPETFRIPVHWFTSNSEFPNDGSDEFRVAGDDFEVRLPQPHTVEISIVSAETGKPVPLEKATTAHTTWPGRAIFDYRRFELKTESNRVTVRHLRDGANRVWVYPTRESKHLASFIDIQIKPDSPATQQLELATQPGILISGQVLDATDGSPVADAAIQYLPDEPGRLLKQGIDYPKFVRSDEKGNYSFVAPRTPAVLQVIGDCENFQTLPIKNARNYQLAVKIPGAISSQLERVVDPGNAESLTISTFKLLKSPVVSGIVVDENEKPLGNVAFVAERDFEMQSRTWIFGKTDENGRFTIKNIFTNAMRNHLTDSQKHNFQGISVFFWHKEGSMGKNVVLTEEELAIKIKLEPTPAVWGRVIDRVTKEPVSGAKVSVQPQWGGLFSTGAITRGDGTFLAEHLSRKRAQGFIQKLEYNGEWISINFGENSNEKLVLELDDIELIKTFAFGKPDQPDSIEGFTKEETLNAAIIYMESQFSKIPKPDPKELNWAGASPAFQFRNLVANNLADHGEVLFDASNSSEFQVRAAAAILGRLGHGMIPKYPITENAREILHRNFDHKDVAPIIRNMEFQWGDTSTVRYAALKYSKNPETRQWAVPFMLSKFPSDIREGLRVDDFRPTDEEFKQTLANLNAVWSTAMTEFPDVEILHFNQGTFREYIDRTLSSIDLTLDGPNIDQIRAREIRATLKKFRTKD